MRGSTILIVVLVALLFTDSCQQQLDPHLYHRSCPQAQPIVFSIVDKSHHHDTRLAASLLRLEFHDCFIQGCDATVLGASWVVREKQLVPSKESTRGLEMIDEIKAALEVLCPPSVSCCADVVALALVARSSTTMSIDVRLSISMAAPVPTPNPDGFGKGVPHWVIYVGVATGLIIMYIGVDVTFRYLEKSARKRGDHAAAKGYEQKRKAWEFMYHASLAACRATPYVVKCFE
ncbi:peroxidase 72-like [Hordeum vulgare subsp. vulgare]|uniref:peroxidase 72-like n=1 Tax=Hordeum vulgare subsp. vulgare TaxID=112509 RepID=UPI001D1A3933|nr:peroxidase 72-like [Hordeum vulgare subsp. vulgare]